MAKIKIVLSLKHKARLKDADYFVIDDNSTECIFYDETGKELWREKEGQKESSRLEPKEQ